MTAATGYYTHMPLKGSSGIKACRSKQVKRSTLVRETCASLPTEGIFSSLSAGTTGTSVREEVQTAQSKGSHCLLILVTRQNGLPYWDVSGRSRPEKTASHLTLQNQLLDDTGTSSSDFSSGIALFEN